MAQLDPTALSQHLHRSIEDLRRERKRGAEAFQARLEFLRSQEIFLQELITNHCQPLLPEDPSDDPEES